MSRRDNRPFLHGGGSGGGGGPAGPPGPAGSDGSDGSDGADGAQGIQGSDGSDGSDGADGAAGADGAQGIQGIQGVPGSGTNLIGEGTTFPAINDPELIWQIVNSADPVNVPDRWYMLVGTNWQPVAFDTFAPAAAPAFTAQPSDQTVAPGNTATIPYTVTDATSYQAYRGATGDTSTPVAGAAQAGFTEGDWQPADAGPYWVRASGPGGTADSNTFTVAVDSSFALSVDTAGGVAVQYQATFAGATAPTIDWGDGTIDVLTSGAIASHTYGAAYAGDVDVEMSGGVITALTTTNDWDYDLADIPVTHRAMVDYRSKGTNKTTGDVGLLTGLVTFAQFFGSGDAYSGDTATFANVTGSVFIGFSAGHTVAGNISGFAAVTGNMFVAGANVNLTGDIANGPNPTTRVYILASNLSTLSGDIVNWNNANTIALAGNGHTIGGSLTGLSNKGRHTFSVSGNNNVLSGPLSGLSGVTSNVTIGGTLNTVTGDPSDLTGLAGGTALTMIVTGQNIVIDTIAGTVPDVTDFRVQLSASTGFDEAEVDKVLADLDTHGRNGLRVYLDGPAHAIPSAAGLVSKTSLEGKGWTVLVNS